MLAALRLIAAASLGGVSSYWLGSLLLLPVANRMTRMERRALAYVLGSAFLSLGIFTVGVFWTVHKAVYIVIATILGLAWAKLRKRSPESLPPGEPISKLWLVPIGLALAAFGAYYLVNALAPEISPDGVSYHLSLVARYVREQRIVPTPTNFYSGLSQGIEMLFLVAYIFGGTSAAALVHLSFLAALAILMISLGRRYGIPLVGAAASLSVFVTPVVGIDASSAYNDLALACAAFACFYLLLIWEQEQRPLIAFFAGCLAGFCYAVKYSGGVAMPLGFLFVAFLFKGRRPSRALFVTLALFTAGSFLLAMPWVNRNAVWYGNPLAPLYNDIFPNNLMHVDFEHRYREHLRNWGELPSKWLIPIELTVRGFALQGLMGPLFFLAPLALLALRNRLGRRLMAAMLFFALPYALNIGTRFLIPSLPFLAFAMLIPIARSKRAVAAFAVAHCLLSWPTVVSLYCNPNAWRLKDFPIRAALRLESEEAFLGRMLYEWPMIDYLKSHVPRKARVFTVSGFADAYANRDIWTGDVSATGERLRYVLWSAHFPDNQPTQHSLLTIPTTQTRKIRIVYDGADSEDGWGVSEVTINGPGGEIPRNPRWLLSAHPNPTDIAGAFDKNPVTSWTTWQPAKKGMYVEVDFGEAISVQSLSILTNARFGRAAMAITVPTKQGWTTLPASSQHTASQEEPEWRYAATSALRGEGIDYILLAPEDFMNFDFDTNPEPWGVTEEFSAKGWRLFRISHTEPGQ